MANSINGAEGLTVQDIRNEIQRGGRLIIYIYCISAVVMTFKRGSKVRLVRAGESRVMAGLSYSLLSFCCGWWGIPFGLIYTIEALIKNFSGGVDITDSWMVATSPVAVPMQVNAEPSQPMQSPPIKAKGSKLPLFIGLGIALLVALGTFGSIVYENKYHIPMVLVNGLDKSYTITVNNQAHEVPSHQWEIIKVPQNIYKIHTDLTNPAIADESVDLRLPWWNLQRRVVMVNPDRLALVYWESVTYGKSGGGDNGFKIYPNQSIVKESKPNYLFEEFPTTLTLKSSESHIRTRLAVGFPRTCNSAVKLIEKFTDQQTAAAYTQQYEKFYPPTESIKSKDNNSIYTEEGKPSAEENTD